MSALSELRETVARLERLTPRPRKPVLAFGVASIDQHLRGGLPRGALHEIAGAGEETEFAGAPTLFIAGLAARLKGPVLWVVQRRDLFAPSLGGVGLHPDRVIYAEAFRSEVVLQTMEEGLRCSGLAAVVGELNGKLGLTASRRLHLAAETSGVTAFILRRSQRRDDPVFSEPVAAVTRWRVGVLASPPPFADAPDVPGLGPRLWQLDLIRCRNGEAGRWIVQAWDAKACMRAWQRDEAGFESAAPARSRAGGSH